MKSDGLFAQIRFGAKVEHLKGRFKVPAPWDIVGSLQKYAIFPALSIKG